MKQKRDKQRTHDTLSSVTSHDSDEEVGHSDYHGDYDDFYTAFDGFDTDSDDGFMDDGFIDECMHQAISDMITMSMLNRNYLWGSDDD